MLTDDKNWVLTSYTNDAWTTIVDEAAVVASILMANTSDANTPTVELRLDDGAGTEVSRILPPSEFVANELQTLDIRSLVVEDGQRLQAKASAAGMHFTASGAA
jgi:hypothetical protein